MAEVMVALSGGVDSSVAAALCIEAGHSVTAVTLKLWGGETDSGCCSVSDVTDARRVANALGVEHHVFNFGDDFQRHVVDPYVADHAAGRTPNPCVECNRHIKFDRLLERADVLGVDLLATGHHARVVDGPGGVRHIGRGADAAKDQSYVLHMLDAPVLRRLLLPVGGLTKDEVRARAAELGLRTADKPDSQDVCFIERSPGRGVAARKAFLGDRIPLRSARIVDEAGTELGVTDSIELVTVGQRKGLDLGGGGERRYVTDIDHEGAVVHVGPRSGTLTDVTPVPDLAWIGEPVDGEVLVQHSAHGRPVAATVEKVDGVPSIRWAAPHVKVAAGQAVVCYAGDLVVAGGTAGA